MDALQVRNLRGDTGADGQINSFFPQGAGALQGVADIDLNVDVRVLGLKGGQDLQHKEIVERGICQNMQRLLLLQGVQILCQLLLEMKDKAGVVGE